MPLEGLDCCVLDADCFKTEGAHIPCPDRGWHGVVPCCAEGAVAVECEERDSLFWDCVVGVGGCRGRGHGMWCLRVAA